jgi:hypothetical protein
MLQRSPALMMAARYIVSPVPKVPGTAAQTARRAQRLSKGHLIVGSHPGECFASFSSIRSASERAASSQLKLASIEARYRYAAAADLAYLFDQALLDAHVPKDDIYSGANSLRNCVFQRLRDGGTGVAQAATVACNRAAPYAVQSDTLSIKIPASRPDTGVDGALLMRRRRVAKQRI